MQGSAVRPFEIGAYVGDVDTGKPRQLSLRPHAAAECRPHVECNSLHRGYVRSEVGTHVSGGERYGHVLAETACIAGFGREVPGTCRAGGKSGIVAQGYAAASVAAQSCNDSVAAVGCPVSAGTVQRVVSAVRYAVAPRSREESRTSAAFTEDRNGCVAVYGGRIVGQYASGPAQTGRACIGFHAQELHGRCIGLCRCRVGHCRQHDGGNGIF